MHPGITKTFSALVGMTIAGVVVCLGVDRENDKRTALQATFASLNITPDQHKTLKRVILEDAPCKDAICEQVIKEYKAQLRTQRALSF